MKKIYTIAILAVALTVTSCEKILDKQPLADFTTNNFYSSEAELTTAVTAAYDPLTSRDGSGYSLDYVLLTDFPSDDARNISTNADRLGLDNLSYDPTNLLIRNGWNFLYRIIFRANSVIVNSKNISMDAARKNRFIAEVRFLRAFAYYQLVTRWGDVPLYIDVAYSTVDEYKVAKSPKDQIWTAIIADLKFAEDNLPANYNATASADAGRATKWAAKSLLAKVYLTRSGPYFGNSNEWQLAADKAKEVIDQSGHDLITRFQDAFLVSNDNGREDIFSAQFVGGTSNFEEGNQLNAYFAPIFTPRYDIVPGQGFGVIGVTSNYIADFSPGDPRVSTTHLVNGQVLPVGATYNGVAVTGSARTVVGDWTLKHNDMGGVTTTARNSSKNYPIIRFAEVLLIYAEAKNEVAAGDATAYTALNRVRARARQSVTPAATIPADLSGLSQAAFRAAVLKERRNELGAEGHRFLDLVRTGTMQAVLGLHLGKVIDPKYNLFPIPQTEIDLNPKLIQNPGY